MNIALDSLFGYDAKPLPRKNEKAIRGVQPNAGIRFWYQEALADLIEEMQRSVAWYVKAAFKKERPAIRLVDSPPVARLAGDEFALDDMASRILESAIKRLRAQWYKRFDTAALKLARYFALKVSARSDAALRKILKDSGFAIDFKMTKAQRDVLNATTQENVALIKSIPEQYLNQVQGAVMRSVATGRDLQTLNADLLKIEGVTKRRAKFIALDQSNKATANLTRVRQLEVAGAGAEAIWCHSSAGKEPRLTHVKAGREKVRYKISQGWWDPAVGEYIFPGQLPNCRCFSRLVVKGFS